MVDGVKGILIGGGAAELVVRASLPMELGELLVAEDDQQRMLFQVYDLLFGSQISSQHLELIGGLQLEGDDATFFDASLRNYTLAHLKPLLSFDKKAQRVRPAKGLPPFFSTVRALTKDDFPFLQRPEHPLFLGNLRSGSHTIEWPVYLDGKLAFSHHLLIAATTGRGKSNLLKCLLWEAVQESYCGLLVLDPHDEYYRHHPGLASHAAKERVHYYSANPLPGSQSLRFHITLLRPQHCNGVLDWTQPQKDALYAYYKEYGEQWIESIVLDKPLSARFQEGTLGVVRRKIMQLLGLEIDDGSVHCNGIFVLSGGLTTITDICNQLEQSHTVVVDTSSLEGALEILVGSIIAHELLARYRKYKFRNELESKPVISIVLEEAPRVLGKEVLEQGPNVFSTIAREGRKFKIGLTAITQLPSLIPREILANMNTKIILGMEMKPERQALIESASQDLSTDDRMIASLDKGEAIITSPFVPFAMPVKIPFFESFIKGRLQETPYKAANAFSGVRR